MSIFVNPAQFAPNEDFSRYPRDEAGDLALCAKAGVDAVFIPSTAEVYPPAAATLVYSLPALGRTKRFGIWANVTIAVPRGLWLKVAGRGMVASVLRWEAWWIGLIFGLFLLGASTTKDFADMEGDARGGCRTLSIVYGVTRAAWMISPSFLVPFLMIIVGAWGCR